MKTATRHTRVGWAWWAAGALAAMLPAALWSASPASAPAPGADTFEPARP
ncbi:MAG: hypothetical protein NT031_10920 [Planctomycetota bacterium]|nr:hypothetical protein [Planctomycetota bacterium]